MTFEEAKAELLSIKFSLDGKIKVTFEFSKYDRGNLQLYDVEKDYTYRSVFQLQQFPDESIQLSLACHGFYFIFPEIETPQGMAVFNLPDFVQFLKKGLRLGENPLTNL